MKDLFKNLMSLSILVLSANTLAACDVPLPVTEVVINKVESNKDGLTFEAKVENNILEIKQKTLGGFNVLATINGIAVNATASLIFPNDHSDPLKRNKAVVSGKTDQNGAFIIDLNAVEDGVYILEVSYRLITSGKIVGSEIVTLRTMVKKEGSKITSVTTPRVYINNKTTALVASMQAGLISSNQVLQVYTLENGIVAVKDLPNLPASFITETKDLLDQILAENKDGTANIVYDLNLKKFVRKNTFSGVVNEESQVTPAPTDENPVEPTPPQEEVPNTPEPPPPSDNPQDPIEEDPIPPIEEPKPEPIPEVDAVPIMKAYNLGMSNSIMNPNEVRYASYSIEATDDKTGLNYLVYLNDVLVSTSQSGQIPVKAGTNTFKFVARDIKNQEAVLTETRNIAMNTPPTISAFSVAPSATRVYDANGTVDVRLDSSYFDEQGVTSVVWESNDKEIFRGAGGIVKLGVGTHRIVLRVRDAMGLESMRETTITITQQTAYYRVQLPNITKESTGTWGYSNSTISYGIGTSSDTTGFTIIEKQSGTFKNNTTVQINVNYRDGRSILTNTILAGTSRKELNIDFNSIAELKNNGYVELYLKLSNAEGVIYSYLPIKIYRDYK
ncbi:MAG: hypothetical protein U0354_19865 [Candidatus Sericytochromatia bacterium]